MQRNDALVPNQAVKCQCLLGKCMFSGWTDIVSSHRVAGCGILHRPGPSETAVLMGWDGIDRGCSKKKRFSVRSVHMGWFPHAVGRAVALALLMREKSKQLSEEGPWSGWVGGLVGEPWEWGSRRPMAVTNCQSCPSVMCVTENTAG